MKTKRMMMPALLGALLAALATTSPAQTSQPPSGADSSGAGREMSSGDAGQTSGGMSSDSAGASEVTVPMVILVPIEVQTDPQLYKGCWVRLRDAEAMPGKGADLLTIVGTMYMPQMKTASGVNWAQKADSLTIGPNATVTVFANENYKGKSATLKSGQVVEDLNKQLGFAKSIDSMRVECTA